MCVLYASCKLCARVNMSTLVVYVYAIWPIQYLRVSQRAERKKTKKLQKHKRWNRIACEIYFSVALSISRFPFCFVIFVFFFFCSSHWFQSTLCVRASKLLTLVPTCVCCFLLFLHSIETHHEDNVCRNVICMRGHSYDSGHYNVQRNTLNTNITMIIKPVASTVY